MEQDGFGGAQEVGDPAFQPHRVGGGAQHGGGSGAVDAELVDHLVGDLLDRRVRGHVEIVFAGEVDAAEVAAGVVARRGHRRRRLVGRARERPQVVLPAQVLPLVEPLDARLQVGAAGIAIIPRTAGQRRGRRVVKSTLEHPKAPTLFGLI
jgi:hypothetical protein